MSRDPHEPTEENRQLVRYLAGVGQRQDDIAIIVGCSEKTLRLHYRNELDEGKADANAKVIGILLRMIQRGDLGAQIFFHKCDGGPKEKPRNIKTKRIPRSSYVHVPTGSCSRERCEDALSRTWHTEEEELRSLTRSEKIEWIRSKIAGLKYLFENEEEASEREKYAVAQIQKGNPPFDPDESGKP